MGSGNVFNVNHKDIAVSGGLLRMARIRSEYYVPAGDHEALIAGFRSAGVKADVFTFVQDLQDTAPKYSYLQGTDSVAVLPVSTYQHWFDKQLFFKPRNKLRKSFKAGVEARDLEFSEALVAAIKIVYDESPTRQGKPNKHYQKPLDVLRREHSSFLDRSQFVGVFFQEEMIGFAKVTHTPSYSVIMNIVAMICHRDKAPTNALIAKCVELCAARNSPLLMYGVWAGEGLTDFKEANGFERTNVPRYFVPLTWRGRLGLRLGLHRGLTEILPPAMIKTASDVRKRLLTLKTMRRATEQNPG